MEPDDIPPLPSLKKRNKKTKSSSMSRSRSFVAEMFHSDKLVARTKPWSSNDQQLLEKMGVSLHDASDNLHPDLLRHACEEQVQSTLSELHDAKKNLLRAAEVGQHLMDENSALEATVVELRNEAAEYIAQLCQLRDENEGLRAQQRGDAYSVHDYQDKLTAFKQSNAELSCTLTALQNELDDVALKHEMESNKYQLLKSEHDKTGKHATQMAQQAAATHRHELEQLQNRVIALQNENQALVAETRQLQQQKTLVENELQACRHELQLQLQNMRHTSDDNETPTGGSGSGTGSTRLQITRRRDSVSSRSKSRSGQQPNIIHVQSVSGSDDNDNDDEEEQELLARCKRALDGMDVQMLRNFISALPSNEATQIRHKRTETLHDYVACDDGDGDGEEHDDEEEDEKEASYEADNEDLDGAAQLRRHAHIGALDARQKQCVDRFLDKYSEVAPPHSDRVDHDELEIEIEFHENVSLEDKKRNRIRVSEKLLLSMTELIERLMGIEDHRSCPTTKTYFSLCGWVCGKSLEQVQDSPSSISPASSDFSSRFDKILRTLDYNNKNREQLYWAIYQLLQMVYKYTMHTQHIKEAPLTQQTRTKQCTKGGFYAIANDSSSESSEDG